MLIWARENGCRWGKACAEGAAQRGHLEVLQWLRANHCPWNSVKVCASAARGGQLAALQWLRATGCDWDAHVCFEAIRKGDVEMLRWARENGCPWDTWLRDRAAEDLGYTDDLGNMTVLLS